jgi:prepilin peptidase CpaA
MPEDPQQLLTIVLVTYAVAVAVVDLATRRIPNGFTVAATAAALVLSASGGAGAGLASACLGMGIALCSFLPMYLAGGLGAGDVKAMAAVGACVGVPGVFVAIGSTLVGGAIAAMAVLLLARELVPAVQRLHANFLLARAGGSPGSIRPAPGAAASRRFPYGIAIAAGALAALWWMGRLEALFAGVVQ